MKVVCGLLGILGFVTMAGVAAAQEPLPPGPPSGGVPKARVGFQLAIRTGYSLPMGDVTGDSGGEMSNAFTGQVPIFTEIGAKVIPNLFVGGYLGLAFGGAAGDTKRFCDMADATCIGIGVRVGAEVQYHILPAGRTNPWIGYGFGFESSGVTMSSDGEDVSSSYTGLEYARFAAGVDFRLTRVFGIGPFAEFSIGEYTRYSIDFSDGADRDGDLDNTATHEWLTLGVRGVFFP